MFILLLSIVHCAVAATQSPPIPNPLQAANDLLHRVVPQSLAPFFQLELLPDNVHGSSMMQLASDPKTSMVILRGTGGIELASALNWYMNDYLNITIDWATYGEGQWKNGTGRYNSPRSTVSLPLPPANGTKVRSRQLAQSYYLNVCTPGYSLAFSNWEYWQKHIDWMALNGINLPLALTGTEYVWNQLWRDEFNFTSADLSTFFSGPAFLPWQRMGNMRGWGGPLSDEWMESQKNLQLLILQRQRELGMRPVLGAFAGFVPSAFAKKFPNAMLTRAPSWAHFAKEYGEVYQLSATDPLFQHIGSRFIQMQTQIYGTDHIYSCDTFNELNPSSGNLTELTASSSAVFAAMSKSDPDAIWLMQGWLFINQFWTEHPERVKAYLAGAPTPTKASPAGMWILDLFGSTKPVWNQPFSHAYYGKPFILCTLLNFGGQQGLFGNLDNVEKGVSDVLAANVQGSANAIGVGITMEGIWTNYIIFERALSLSWEPTLTSQETGAAYATRRYGGYSTGASAAWSSFLMPMYHGGEGTSGPGSAISSFPSPLLPTPAAPPGYQVFTAQGYWGNRVLHDVCTVEQCAWHCTVAFSSSSPSASCVAFEVDLVDTKKPGNCYLFHNLNETFHTLVNSMTYVKKAAAAAANQEAIMLLQREPRSMLEHIAMKSQHPTSQIYTDILQSTIGSLSTDLDSSSVLSSTWTLLMHSIPDLSNVASFRFDLVDVARCVVAGKFSDILTKYQDAFATRNRSLTKQYSTELLIILDDYDSLLSSNKHFMVGRWIQWARESVPNASIQLQNHLEFNARNQITLWGPHGEINDYAKKEWGGLVSSYYKQRYSLMFDMVDKMLVPPYPKWNTSNFENAVLVNVELPWSNDTTTFPSMPDSEHDLMNVIQILYQKYVQDDNVVVVDAGYHTPLIVPATTKEFKCYSDTNCTNHFHRLKKPYCVVKWNPKGPNDYGRCTHVPPGNGCEQKGVQIIIDRKLCI